MCESCLDLYQKLKDVDRACRRAGCKGTWLDKRGAQLARAVRGKTGEPYPQYCENCAKELGDLDDRQVACKTDNCTGTWTWTKAAQLAAGVRPTPRAPEAVEGEGIDEAAPADEGGAAAPAEAAMLAAPSPDPAAPLPNEGPRRKRKNKKRREIRPPERRCQTCLEFLADRKTIEIGCKGCHTPIYWPPESQLQTHLGAWSEPTLCGACKRDLTEAQRMAEREALRHPHVEAPAPNGEAPEVTASAEALEPSTPEPPAPEAPAPEAPVPETSS
jgi:hypothetical protein